MRTILFLIVFSIISFSVNAQAENKSKNSNPFASKASIAGKQGGAITKDELLNSNGVETADSSHFIKEYKLTVIGKNVRYIEHTGKDGSGALTDEMKASIREGSAGTKIYVEYIRCTNNGTHTHILAPLSFVLL
jgi:hypothetical protein